MFFFGLRVYQDTVDINNAKLIKEFSQGVIHGLLGCDWGVGEPERHNKEVKQPIAVSTGCKYNTIQPIAAAECYFPLVTLNCIVLYCIVFAVRAEL